jgi:hypothetical protein
MARYKIVEIRKDEFVIYTKKRFFWKRLERSYRGWMIPVIFDSYNDALAQVTEMVASANAEEEEKLAKQKFKMKSTYFNKDGKEYDPMYGDGTKKPHGPLYIP